MVSKQRSGSARKVAILLYFELSLSSTRLLLTSLTVCFTVTLVILLLLVIKAKVHPFVALLIVSLLVAIATGIPAEKIMETIMSGMGGLLGHIAIIIVLGAMLGAVIEASGGAESLAQRFSKSLGIRHTVAALTMAAFILDIPVFFEVGFIIVIPLIYGFTKVARVSPLKFGLPMAGVMLTVHVALPTHPGAVFRRLFICARTVLIPVDNVPERQQKLTHAQNGQQKMAALAGLADMHRSGREE